MSSICCTNFINLSMKHFDMVKTGKLIKELRTELGMTQTQLADKIGSVQCTIAQYENGSSKLSVDILMNVAQALETSADYLLGLTD